MNESIRILWNVALSLIEGIGVLWEWLTNEFTLKFLGYTIFSATPIYLIGGGFVAIIIFWFIKGLVPAS